MTETKLTPAQAAIKEIILQHASEKMLPFINPVASEKTLRDKGFILLRIDDESVEAGAKALYSLTYKDRYEWNAFNERTRRRYRERAKAVITAAAGTPNG